MKILWWSTAPWSFGSYSILTTRVIPDLIRNGYEAVLGTWYGIKGGPLPWTIPDGNGGVAGKVIVLPAVGNEQFEARDYGIGLIDAVYEQFEADMLITCGDVWVFNPSATGQCNFCPWFPIDHDPIIPHIADALEPAIYPMCYSRWGVEVLEKANITAHYVPCSAPASVFKTGNKAKARKILECSDEIDFLITMVAANKDPQDRKGFNEALQAFAQFHQNHPNSLLYLHTNVAGPVNIIKMANALDIQDHIMVVDQFLYNFGMLKQENTVTIYQASDVLLNPAKSEGFGLPILEAQMCGTPVIATDYSTTNELLWAGWRVDTIPDWTPGAESFRVRAKIDSIVEALEEAYKDKDNDALKRQARTGAITLDTPGVFEEYWKPALRDIENLISTTQIEVPKFEMASTVEV